MEKWRGAGYGAAAHSPARVVEAVAFLAPGSRRELGQHNSVQHLVAQTGLTLLHGLRRQGWLTVQYLSLSCPQERLSLLLCRFF
uniref:Uncharacterized protein n=1 Tax=Buteo japonicus TaxID=224669 RepID=A0A8C0BMW0_9AVES